MAKQPKNSTGPQTTSEETAAPESAPVESPEEVDGDFLPGEGPEETNSTSEGNSDVNDVTTSAPEGTEDTNSADQDKVLGDAAAEVLKNATPVETVILDPNSLPMDALIQKTMIQSALSMVKAYDAQRATYLANTSDKEVKAQMYVRDLHAEHEDTLGFSMREQISELEMDLANLQERIAKARETFAAHVDAELSKSDTVWDKETADAKHAELTSVFKAVKQIRATAAETIETYNKHRKPGTPDIGTIDNYVPPVEKPSGGISTSGSKSSTSDGTTGRAPMIARAELRKPGEADFVWTHRQVGKNDVSNAEIVAQVISEHAGTKVTKEDIWAAWLGKFGTSVENLDKSLVPVESEFTFEVDGKSYEIKFTRKTRQQAAA